MVSEIWLAKLKSWGRVHLSRHVYLALYSICHACHFWLGRSEFLEPPHMQRLATALGPSEITRQTDTQTTGTHCKRLVPMKQIVIELRQNEDNDIWYLWNSSQHVRSKPP